MNKRLDKCDADVKELAIDRRQMKAMLKNQNYHFTEL